MKKIIIIFATLSLLFACDEVFDYNFCVKNLTDKEILVYYHTGNLIQNYWDTISIEQNKQKQIYVEHAAGGRKLKGVDICIIFDTIFIKMDTIQSSIDFRKNDTWEYRELSLDLGEYTLTIDSTHFK